MARSGNLELAYRASISTRSQRSPSLLVAQRPTGFIVAALARRVFAENTRSATKTERQQRRLAADHHLHVGLVADQPRQADAGQRADHAAGEADQHRLQQKLAQDVALARANRDADADFVRVWLPIPA